MHWVAGHVNLTGNELADTAAKSAAKDAEEGELPYITSASTICGIIKKGSRSKWQRMWKHATTGRELYESHPTSVPTTKYISVADRTSEIRLLRLRAGHSAVKEKLYRMNLTESPICDCGQDMETAHHRIMRCPLLNRQRETLFNEVDFIFMKHQTPIWDRHITLNSLLWPTHLSRDTAQAITNVLLGFLKQVKL